MDNWSRVFAEQKLPGSGDPVKPEKELQVTGTAKISRPADRASMRVSVGSTKESVSEVTSSVSRRLDYILQAVRENGVGVKDTSVTKFLRREADQYRMDAEVVVTFSEFSKMDQVRSVLLEKLDDSVCVGPPHFYHSGRCLQDMGEAAFVSAVDNAQDKARSVCPLLIQTLGPPLVVREVETKEWKSEEEDGGRGQGAAPLPLFPCAPTVTVYSRVSVSFSLRDQERF